MKYTILFCLFILYSGFVKAQTLEDKLTTSACQYLDSLNLSKITTLNDKKTAITFIFAKAVAANQQAINKDKRFAGLTSYEQGKKLGQLMAQDILPIMNLKCLRFKKLVA
jgi:hypothetical protein